MSTMNVTKATGGTKPYDETKLCRFFANAGADQQIIDQITEAMEEIIYHSIYFSYPKRYRKAFCLLKQPPKIVHLVGIN